MDKNNILRLRLISFLSYAFTGALIVTTGIVLSEIAKYFHTPISSMSNTFTFLNSGILIAILVNSWLMEIITMKHQLIYGFLLIISSIIGLICGHNIKIFSISMFILGIVSGITMSIGTQLVTQLYTGKQRGIQLLITDSFFSMAGIIFPMLSSLLLAYNITWYWIYICISSLYVLIFFLTVFSEFPLYIKSNINHLLDIKKEPWGIGIIILSIASLCYILGQLSFVSWVPEYVSTYFSMNIKQSGALIGRFWIAYMIGMWTFSIILHFFDLQFILTILSTISTIFMYLFIHTNNTTLLKWYLLGLGFFSSAIYTSIITLGSQQTKIISPKLVNVLLTCGTIGTMLTFVVTSPIMHHYGVGAALKTSNILYGIVSILCFTSRYTNKNKEIYKNNK